MGDTVRLLLAGCSDLVDAQSDNSADRRPVTTTQTVGQTFVARCGLNAIQSTAAVPGEGLHACVMMILSGKISLKRHYHSLAFQAPIFTFSSCRSRRSANDSTFGSK
jgi:hypothetical protein